MGGAVQRSTTAQRAAGAAAVLLLGLTTACGAGDAGAGGAADDAGATGSSSSSAADPGPVPSATPAGTAARVGAVTPEVPVSITLPDTGPVPVRSVSTTANGLLDVPDDLRQAGWWRGGSQVGDPFGSTLIAAHVDSRTEGLGPFASLLQVRPGERVVLRTETLEQRFEITSLRLRPRDGIGPGSRLHSPEGSRRLTLVTCAGPFVPALGGYQKLAVVVAVPLGEPVPRAA